MWLIREFNRGGGDIGFPMREIPIKTPAIISVKKNSIPVVMVVYNKINSTGNSWLI